MKRLFLIVGLIALIISTTHGFFTDQSVVHSLLLHPVVVILSLLLIGCGLDSLTLAHSTQNKAQKHTTNQPKTFAEKITPYVQAQLNLANKARANGDFITEFKHLENAHVLGQQSTYFHTLIHWHMLIFGWRHHLSKEIVGQIIRLVGALTKTAVGLLPIGNTGGANVSAFKPMPLSKEHKTILDKVTK